MSGRKNSLVKYQLVTSGDMSGNITSAATNIQNLDNVGIQANISGTPTGTLAVQVSIDHAELNGQVTVAGSWSTILTQAITAGSPAMGIFDLNQLSAMYVRIIYTFGSSTGTLNAFICGKMI